MTDDHRKYVPFGGTKTGRTKSAGPMPQSNHPKTEDGQAILKAFREQFPIATAKYEEIEKRIRAGATVLGVNKVRSGKETVSDLYVVKSRGEDMTESHEAQRVVYNAVTGRIAHDSPNGARTQDVISKNGCNGCNAKPGEGHLFDCPDLAARMMIGKHIDEKHAEGQNYRDVLDKLARKD